MYNISKILVPVDFSEPSANGLRYAASLAQKNGAAICALHVMSKERDSSFQRVLTAFEGWPIASTAATRLPLDRLLGESALDLYNFIEKVLGRGFGQKIGRQVRIGEPLKEIVAAVRQLRADLVVIERPRERSISFLRHRGAVSGFALKVPCPVLLAPPASAKISDRPSGPGLPANLRLAYC